MLDAVQSGGITPMEYRRPSLKKSKDDKPAENVSGKVAEANVAEGESVNPYVSLVVSDEVLRHRIRTLIDEKVKPSKFQSISTHPLLIVVVSFILSIFIGGFLTHYYSLKQMELENSRNIQQQELARQRSFSDELNKIRIQKIGEVWEQLDKTEVDLDSLLDRANNGTNSNRKDVDSIISLVKGDLAIINKNRFWLGEQTYNQIKDYLDINGRYALDKLLGQPGIDLSDSLKKREQAKQDILQIRRMFLKGELESSK